MSRLYVEVKKNKISDSLIFFGDSMKNRTEFIFFIVIFVLLLIQFDPIIFTGGDNAYYISLADSMFRNQTYRTEFMIDSPYEVSIPPGYPLLIFFIKLFFPDSYIPIKILSFIAFFIALIYSYRLLILYDIKRIYAFSVILLFATTTSISEYASLELSEAPFMAFLIPGLYYLEIFVNDPLNKRKLFWIFSALLIFAVYIRLPGIVILPACIVYIWWRLGKKFALKFALTCFLALAPWFLWANLAPSETGNAYLKNFTKVGVYEGDEQSISYSVFHKRIRVTL
jgi:hypothetical protein